MGRKSKKKHQHRNGVMEDPAKKYKTLLWRHFKECPQCSKAPNYPCAAGYYLDKKYREVRNIY